MKRRNLRTCCNLRAPPCPICKVYAVEDLLKSGQAEKALSLIEALREGARLNARTPA